MTLSPICKLYSAKMFFLAIGFSGADEATAMATTATAEWGLCVPFRWWRGSSYPAAAATAAATPLHVSTHGTPPPAPGLHGF